ncbi:hypothetical protein M1328_04225, partial [Patescibacteria group bacterium]|nr:hypothetical protein [Patescibacteria group bacterium]
FFALDNYNKQMQVWKVPDGSYYVVARYDGRWNTFAGTLSPENGTVEGSDASGTMHGGYAGTFTGSCNSAFGNLGSYDFGGTKSDVMLGTYGAGQTGPTSVFSALSYYCPGYSNLNYSWGWTYQYKNQTWNNFDYGTTGDIVVP